MECLNCKSEQEKKFCSKSCSTSFHNRARKKIKFCKHCDVQLSGFQKIFCSNQCQRDYQFMNDTLKRFLEGLVIDNTTLKRCLVYTQGDNCECCKISNEWNHKPLSLQVDHIDGNSDNNEPNNLRLLCPNCHSQTETFSGRNTNITKDMKRNVYLRNYYKRRSSVQS